MTESGRAKAVGGRSKLRRHGGKIRVVSWSRISIRTYEAALLALVDLSLLCLCGMMGAVNTFQIFFFASLKMEMHHSSQVISFTLASHRAILAELSETL